jgi:hypothetical protein
MMPPIERGESIPSVEGSSRKNIAMALNSEDKTHAHAYLLPLDGCTVVHDFT